MGERIWRDDNEGSDDVILCGRCYENEYTHCTRCGRLLRNDHAYYLEDDDDPLCEHCYMIADASPIHEYGYKPDPIFYGTGPRYFGVELEIDEAGERNRNAETLLDIGNRDAVRIYCKHDGSLDDGFEIVTHPMSLEYHEKNMPWEEIMDKAAAKGVKFLLPVDNVVANKFPSEKDAATWFHSFSRHVVSIAGQVTYE